MKAWKVTYGDDMTCWVLSDDRGAATSRAIREDPANEEGMDIDWSLVRTVRAPEYDGDAISYRRLWEDDHCWVECDQCGCRLDHSPNNVYGWENDPAAVIWKDDYNAYCDERCAAVGRMSQPYETPDIIHLYQNI